MKLHPNSAGVSELGEVGWTEQARQASIISRQSKALYQKGVARRPVTPKAAAPAKPKGPTRPKRKGETRNDAGERVLSYDDGSTVTVRADGTAVHRAPNGVERVGVYKDPRPPNTDPEGFSMLKPRDPKARRALRPRGPQRVRWST